MRVTGLLYPSMWVVDLCEGTSQPKPKLASILVTKPPPRGWETSTTDVISHNFGGWRIQVKDSVPNEICPWVGDGCLLVMSLCDGESSHFSYVSPLFIEIQLTYNVVLIFAIQKSDSLSSVQFSSVMQSCLTLCNPMDCSTSDLPVHHQLPEFSQIHVH